MDYYKQDVVARTEEVYGHYTQLLELHAMELVGKALPPIDGSDERFVPSSVQEAQQYQEAVNSMLVRQMRGEIEAMRQADDEVISVVHDSITLFQNNPDLIPNSKSFNKPLADHVMKLVQPYALRLDGKLTGFSIDIQGIIDQARGQFKAAPPAPTKKAATGRTTAPRPQGGLASKAGTSGAGDEDFTPMWNALGIDNMPV